MANSRLSEYSQDISLATALAIIKETCHSITTTETVALAVAGGRVLAADIFAPIAVPPTDNSAVDGYAFSHSHLKWSGETSFRITGTAAAGHAFVGQLGNGEAARIFTGAVIPDGADTVAMQENVSVARATVNIPAWHRYGENRRLAGEDIPQGCGILSAGKHLGPAELGILASLGIGQVEVRARLRAAVFSVGDELVDGPGDPRAIGQIYDSNRPMLLALLKGLGIETTDFGILPDRLDAITLQLGCAAKSYDVIVCSAGMSVGDEDHMRPAVNALGTLDFWRVAIKPGHPIAVGRVGKTAFFGLPGNPFAMIVDFLMIVRPALLRLAGTHTEPPRRFPVVADFAMNRKVGKREFLRCTLRETTEGCLVARRLEHGGSGVLSSVIASDGLLEINEDIDAISPGMILPFVPFSELGL